MARKQRGGQGRKTDSRHALEWIVAALGVLILGGSIGYLSYTALKQENTPPSITFRAGAIHPVSGGYLVELTLRNEGGEAAAKLKVEGLLVKDERIVEASEATFDYLPSQSERRGGLFFANNPRQFELRFQAKGYEKP
jgi:uncharacterized protein (TIGR02588 family)